MQVLLVATGGTIASRPSPDGGGVTRALSGAELLARAGLEDVAVEVLDLTPGPSWALTPDAVEAIARAALGAGADGYGGVVVTHGTDTIEESLFLTWLLGGGAEGAPPIVFTGAMRHDAHPEADGPVNLREAVALAAAGSGAVAAGAGPVLRIGGATHHARWARKTDTSTLDSFRSVGAGAPAPPPLPPRCGEGIVPAVAEIHTHTGVDGSLVDTAVERGARGLVVVGTGAGNVHGSLMPGIDRAIAAGVPVVVTSRCFSGPVQPEYGGPGGGRSLADAGAVLAGDLPTNKARVALWVALGADPSVDAVRAWFGELLG